MDNPAEFLGKHYTRLRTFPGLDSAKLEIERIGDQSYISEQSLGLSATLPDHENIGVVQLYSDGHEGYAEYVQTLPCGLSFDMSQERVRESLGSPDVAGDERQVPVLGLIPAWDLFRRDAYDLHVRYDFDRQCIQMISLMVSHSIL